MSDDLRHNLHDFYPAPEGGWQKGEGETVLAFAPRRAEEAAFLQRLSRNLRVLILPETAEQLPGSGPAALFVTAALPKALQLAAAAPRIEAVVVIEPEAGGAFAPIGQPVLAVLGAQAEPVRNGASLTALEGLRSAAPQTEVFLIHGAAGSALTQRPEAVLRVTLDFLRRKEAHVVSDQPTALYTVTGGVA